MKSMAVLGDLPNELLLLVAAQCSVGTLCVLARVSNRLNRVVLSANALSVSKLERGNSTRLRLFLRSLIERPALQKQVRILDLDFLDTTLWTEPEINDDEEDDNEDGIKEQLLDEDESGGSDDNGDSGESDGVGSDDDNYSNSEPGWGDVKNRSDLVALRHTKAPIADSTRSDLNILLLAATRNNLSPKWRNAIENNSHTAFAILSLYNAPQLESLTLRRTRYNQIEYISKFVKSRIQGQRKVPLPGALQNLTTFVVDYHDPDFDVCIEPSMFYTFLSLPNIHTLCVWRIGVPRETCDFGPRTISSNLKELILLDAMIHSGDLFNMLSITNQLTHLHVQQHPNFIDRTFYGKFEAGFDFVKDTLESLSFSGSCLERHSRKISFRDFPRLKELKIPAGILCGKDPARPFGRIIEGLPPTIQGLTLFHRGLWINPGIVKETAAMLVEVVDSKEELFPNLQRLTMATRRSFKPGYTDEVKVRCDAHGIIFHVSAEESYESDESDGS